MDGTLVLSGRAGRAFYASAFMSATGCELRKMVFAGGRLDPEIFLDSMAANGLEPDAALFSAFAAALIEEHTAGDEVLRTSGRSLPGGAEAIAALAGRADVVQSVLTGNIEAVAHRKLAAFGLDRDLDLSVGAYGEDAPLRPGLVEIARRRAGSRYGADFSGERTVLIGDTVHDVGAALASGARVVAVASGRTPAPDLAAAGASVVFEDLTDTGAVTAAIIG